MTISLRKNYIILLIVYLWHHTVRKHDNQHQYCYGLVMQYDSKNSVIFGLTHWGRVMHICVNKLTIIGSDNGLSPGRRQAIIWPNAGMIIIGPLGTNFSEILIEILTLSFKKMRLKVSSTKWRSFCLGFNVLSNSLPYNDTKPSREPLLTDSLICYVEILQLSTCKECLRIIHFTSQTRLLVTNELFAHFVTEICTCVQVSVTKCCITGCETGGICATGHSFAGCSFYVIFIEQISLPTAAFVPLIYQYQ